MKINFCWECGRKLHGDYWTEKEIDGQIRTLHKICAENLNNPDYKHFEIQCECSVDGGGMCSYCLERKHNL